MLQNPDSNESGTVVQDFIIILRQIVPDIIIIVIIIRIVKKETSLRHLNVFKSGVSNGYTDVSNGHTDMSNGCS